jgi:hypothetical protein
MLCLAKTNFQEQYGQLPRPFGERVGVRGNPSSNSRHLPAHLPENTAPQQWLEYRPLNRHTGDGQ